MRAAIAVVLLGLASSGAPAAGQGISDDERYIIMRPEPSLAPKYKSPRGTRQKVEPPRAPPAIDTRIADPPPPILLPGGQLVPNLAATPQGAAPAGRESFSDRTIRCTHQAGVFSVPAEQRNAYVGACVNQ